MKLWSTIYKADILAEFSFRFHRANSVKAKNPSSMRLSRRNGLTPMLRLAIKIQSVLFKVLYPGIYHIETDGAGFINLRFNKLTTRYIPWCSSFFGITLGCGWSSCLVILVHQTIRCTLRPWVQWSFLATIISMLLWLLATIEVVVLILWIRLPEVIKLISVVQQLERQCK